MNQLFTADPVFVELGFEGRIFGRGGGVAVPAGVADAEELFLDRRAAVEIVFSFQVQQHCENDGVLSQQRQMLL